MDVGLLFDEVAEQYDRVRPRYPDELFADVATLTGAPKAARVLEVGPGPGQATEGLLAQGWHVHAVEPGAAMAARAARNAAGQPFTVDIATFDDWDPAGRTYDILFSATAYHWVAPEIRWQRAAAVLEPGSAIALATNRTVSGGTFTDVYRESADLHAKYAKEVEFGVPSDARSILDEVTAVPNDIGAVWDAVESKSGPTLAGDLFTAPVIRWYEWETAYDTADAIALLSTYSPYLKVPPHRRGPLFAAMADLIRTRFGGRVTRTYLAVLAVAQRRG
jgi:SAM-dependent methyltransferase